MQVIFGVWQFRDDLSSYTLTQNTGYALTNDEYFVSNGNQYTSIDFYKATLDNKINKVEYEGFVVYDNQTWDNPNYQYIDFGTGVTISDDVYTIITALASQVANLQVIFRNNDNSVITQIPTQSVAYGHTATRPVYVPTYQGSGWQNMEFVDWSSTRETYTQFDFNTPIIADTTIYAYYRLKPHVTYYSYGIAIDIEYVNTGELATPPADPTPQGHDLFVNWSISDEENIPFDFGTPITENIDLYAWFISPYTVTFWNENVIYDTQEIFEGDFAEKPEPDPISSDELNFFKGWSSSDDEYLEFDFNIPITGNINLYAFYDRGNYVTFINENRLYEEQVVEYNGTAIKPVTDPTSSYPNKKFKGWSQNKTEYVYFSFLTPITQALTLYAYYEIVGEYEAEQFDYINYLGYKLSELKKQFEIDGDILIGDERIFENSNAKYNDILVLVKYLSASYEFNAKTQPIQISIFTKDNVIENAKLLFNAFTERNNWTVINNENNPEYINGTQYIKQQYSSPVIINSFAETDNGFRAIMLINANLFVIDNILDLSNLTINNVSVKPLTYAISYNMTGNTQQFPNDYISKTVKSGATFSITMSLPMINYNGVKTNEHIITQDDLTYGYFIIQKSSLPVYLVDLKDVKLARTGTEMEWLEYEDYYRIEVLSGTREGDIVNLNFDYYLVKHILQILKGISTGNDDFKLEFDIGDIHFEKNMKIIAFQFNTNPEQIAGFSINFME